MAETIDLKLESAAAQGKAALPPLPRLSGYELIREKGRGPKAVVYKARRIFENDTVAIKYFHPGACDATTQARIETGIERTAKFEHPGLIRALGIGREGGSAFLVMEYASGEALSSFLFRRQLFPVSKTISVILHCARTLKSAAANGFHHGRLHPGAIMLSRNNVRIAGVGMGERPGHAEWPAGKNQAPHVFEPLIYTAPEAMPSNPAPQNFAAADIYSLGAILFHMLACSPPFKSSDEGDLNVERAAIKPRHSVIWPVEVFGSLSPEMIELVEAMLAPDPVTRLSYDAVILRCMAIQNVLQKTESVPGKEPVALGGTTVHPAPTLFDGEARTAMSKEKLVTTKPSSENLVATIPVNSERAVEPKAEKLTSHSARHSLRKARVYAPRSAADVIFSTLLFCMTGLALLCVGYISLQPQLPQQYQFLKALLVQDIPAQTNQAVVPSPAEKAPAPKTLTVTASQEEQYLAQRQLEMIQAMLRNNDIMVSESLVKVLRGIADKAGRATPTGISAAILAGDIELRLTPAKLTPEVVKALTSATEAMKNAAQQPPPQTAVPVIEKQHEAPKAPAAPAQPAVAGAAAPIQQARQQMKYFGYAKAKETLAQFAAKGDTEQKRLADDFRVTINYEEGLYERSRTKLLEAIKKSPKRESPLQVFPRKDDPLGDDIINFDEKGIHILVRGGPTPGEKVTPWDRLPAAQIMNLLAPLTAKNNLEDQLGLAAFAFNRNLATETDEAIARAQAISGGKDGAIALSNIFARIAKALELP